VTTTMREELPSLAQALEGESAAEILSVIAPRFPRWIGLASSFGPEDCVLVDVVARAKLPVEIFTLDTGFLFAETYALWTRLEERYGIRIRAERPEAPPLDRTQPPPWELDPDACCELRKVRPLRRALSRYGAWVTGIRRDQTPDRANAQVVEWDARFGLFKVNPLAAWRSEDVWAYVRRHDVPTNPLHAEGYLSIGCAPCTSPVKLGEDPRAGRWRGQDKKECGLHVERIRTAPGQPHPAAPPSDLAEGSRRAPSLAPVQRRREEPDAA
jgi:phosphoadenosine phosphosulfate reductase